ncbi:hypothetical protein M413DRAFT_5966 [Hebeloma cylindrosporum]|uniref:ZNF598/HEL2 PAH domain-containing protein n=1 Tax=Hebeloma cylindrosporum TaxID=76867 RepID=A0A0C2Z5S3_HEBCY|nr:hypothetical protein M413DRAFT_5966 [Hebeloma cylindrosporum h7]
MWDKVADMDMEVEGEIPPPHQQQQAASSTPVSAAAPAARPPGVGRRREVFGAALTQPDQGTSTTTTTTNAAARNTRPASPQVPTTTSDIDPAVAEKHASFLARLQSLALNPATAVPAVKSATRSYRLTESTSRDLILTIWNVVDRNLEHTASLVNAFIDLLEEEEKKQDLLASWKGFAIEQRRQFPDLTPTSVGEGYAGITSGRVLNAKHSTATRSSQSQQVWNRVALAAGSSGSNPSSLAEHFPLPPTAAAGPSRPVQERFPSLGGGSGPSSSSSTTTTTAPRPGQRATPWSASSATPPALRTQATIVSSSGPAIKAGGGRSGPKQAPPKLSNSLFPELPTSSSSRASVPQVKGNVSLKNILGASNGPAVVAWGGGGGGGAGGGVGVVGVGNANTNAPGSDSAAPSEVGEGVQTGKGGKKGKGKQKQTLFTLGSFPTVSKDYIADANVAGKVFRVISTLKFAIAYLSPLRRNYDKRMDAPRRRRVEKKFDLVAFKGQTSAAAAIGISEIVGSITTRRCGKGAEPPQCDCAFCASRFVDQEDFLVESPPPHVLDQTHAISKHRPPPPPSTHSTTPTEIQLGGGGLTDSMSQQRSQYPHTDPASRRSEPTTIRAPGASNAEEERPSAAAGDSEDDEATLVSSSEAHVCQDSRDSSDGLVLFKDNGPKHPISLIHRRILDHIPGFSDDEGDDVHDIPSTAPRRRSRTRTPTPPSRCWGMRGTAHIEFEVTQEERAIISNTALKPPPWHQQSNEKQCG